MSGGLSISGIALITGANKGIGLEVVRQLATRGWRVFLTGRSLASVRKAASPLGPSVTPLPL
ncbi:MAG TPA: SDR family NAD(P)-dependent oxidoreductase, partial [Nitrospira sp.]|nr:SDR family NAD(P)-dependent oxidoreductase [Nitrospira sp.]